MITRRFSTLSLLILFLFLTPILLRSQSLPNDSATLLLVRFDNADSGAAGERPIVSAGIDYAIGTFFAAFSHDPGDSLAYGTAENLLRDSGTIEFWFRPSFAGNDNLYHTLFSIGRTFTLFKDSTANRLRLLSGGTDDTELGSGWSGTANGRTAWVSGKWHHIAVTWTIPGRIRTYVDGMLVMEQKALAQDAIAPSASRFWIGSGPGGTAAANGRYDDLRISNRPRTGQEIARAFMGGITVDTLYFEITSLRLWPTWTWKHNRLTGITGAGDTIAVPLAGATWTHRNPLPLAIDTLTGTIIPLTSGIDTITAKVGSKSTRQAVEIRNPIVPPVHQQSPAGLSTITPTSLYTIPVVIVRYLPTDDGLLLDSSASTGGTDSLNVIELQANINRIDRQVRFALQEGSRFHDYGADTVRPSLNYRVVDIITIYEPTPPGEVGEIVNGRSVYTIDYANMLERIGGERFVDSLGVREIWVWQPESRPDGIGYSPSLHRPEYLRMIDRSNMSSTITPDISLSSGIDDLPHYHNNVTLFGQNIRSSMTTILRNHARQLEELLKYVGIRKHGSDTLVTRRLFGQNGSGTQLPGRVGSVRMPPNTSTLDNYTDTTDVQSDIRDWRPNGGANQTIDASAWLDAGYRWPEGEAPSSAEKGAAHWYIFWMQSLPGYQNQMMQNMSIDTTMNNWWEFTADWDGSNWRGLGLYGTEPMGVGFRYPQKGATGISSDTLFVWDTVPHATGYRLQIGTDPTFESGTLVDSTWTIESGDTGMIARRITGIPEGVPLFWRIRPQDAPTPETNETRWSESWAFRTGLPAPDSIHLISPPDKSTVVADTVIFRWEPDPRGVTYHVRIAEDSTFTKLVVDTTLVSDTIQNIQVDSLPVRRLDHNRTYYWNVSAANRSGSGPLSETWSLLNRRRTANKVPERVEPIIPVDREILISPSVLFRWHVAEYQTNGYLLQIASDTSFTQIVDQLTLGANDTVASLFFQEGKRYYWRVRGKNLVGNGPFSIRHEFSIREPIPLPGIPVLISPNNGGSFSSPSTTFLWHTVTPEVTQYEFQLGEDSLMTTVVADLPVNAPDTFIIPTNLPLDLEKWYWWRVRGVNGSGWGEYSQSYRIFNGPTNSVETGERKSAGLSLAIRPNPVSRNGSIEIGTDRPVTGTVELISPTGMVLRTWRGERVEPERGRIIPVDLEELPSGLWFCRLTTDDGGIQVVRFLLVR